ncbi:MAG: helix-turn-helix domain-containing protein [Lachnospiraceae bacterium]
MQDITDLLATTPLPTGEVAIKAGYSDKNYFSLAFRRKTGMTPTEYREKNSIHRTQ